MRASERRLQVLQAIVQDYVHTREPVGSRALVERHGLEVSPATIRNDMAALEEAGLITQPHTSAGRIPTDQGYRAFVDQISRLKPLSAAEKRAIESLLHDAVDLEDILERSVRLLAALTQQVAVVQYPSLHRAVIRHLELVSLSPRLLLVVIITDSGRVEQRTIASAVPLEEAELVALKTALNQAVAGLRLPELREPLAALCGQVPVALSTLVDAIGQELVNILQSESVDRVAMAGTANLARTAQDFQGTIGPVLQALEEQVILLKIFSEMTDDEAVSVRIGQETHHDSLAETSLVTSTYSAPAETLAALGIVGPTRMDYPATMTIVRAVARYISKILNGEDES
ncbi:MAG: heat-inducible transcriptional repressor HrcA [Bowdeniella nasicola]|nr:heat-inducible transcriptional repressor HrcA [Bowdeniella nasicola]